MPKAPTLKKAKNTAIGAAIYFTYVKGEPIIYIEYSTSKKFKNSKTKKADADDYVYYNLTGLKAHKTYYVRIRAGFRVSGQIVCTAWSNTKKLKT